MALCSALAAVWNFDVAWYSLERFGTRVIVKKPSQLVEWEVNEVVDHSLVKGLIDLMELACPPDPVLEISEASTVKMLDTLEIIAAPCGPKDRACLRLCGKGPCLVATRAACAALLNCL